MNFKHILFVVGGALLVGSCQASKPATSGVKRKAKSVRTHVPLSSIGQDDEGDEKPLPLFPFSSEEYQKYQEEDEEVIRLTAPMELRAKEVYCVLVRQCKLEEARRFARMHEISLELPVSDLKYTAIMMAACNDHTAISPLLKAGAKIDAVDGQGVSSLMHVAMIGKNESVQKLLKHKACPHIVGLSAVTDGKRYDALELARVNGYLECAQEIEKALQASVCCGQSRKKQKVETVKI